MNSGGLAVRRWRAPGQVLSLTGFLFSLLPPVLFSCCSFVSFVLSCTHMVNFFPSLIMHCMTCCLHKYCYSRKVIDLFLYGIPSPLSWVGFHIRTLLQNSTLMRFCCKPPRLPWPQERHLTPYLTLKSIMLNLAMYYWRIFCLYALLWLLHTIFFIVSLYTLNNNKLLK